MDSEIKFGFWNYLPVGTIDKSIVHKWVDINSNLFMSFRYIRGKSKKEDMIALLDEANKLGYQVIINDERTEYLRLKEMSKSDFVKGVKEAVEDFGYHPATFGFYGGDEPFSDQEENFTFTMSLLKQLLPEKHHYGNLLPYWSGLLGEPSENNREDSYYYNKINRIINDGKLDILAFDQYTQCYDESNDQKKGIESFINSMIHMYNLAKSNNLPLYVSLLSIGHWCYREPTEIDIKWQINVSMVMGAKGIIWFYFHQTAKDYGYLNPPFLGERAYITPMFGKIQRQQYIFQERYKDLFDQIDIDEVYFRGDLFKEKEYVADKMIVDRFDIRLKDKLTIISFAHFRKDPSHRIMFITNGEQQMGNVYSIYFKNGEAHHFNLSPGDIKIFDLKGK